MVTGAKRTPQMVPEFRTGRPVPSQTTSQRPILDDYDHLDTTLPVPDIQPTATPADPLNRFAEGLVGVINRSSAQTLMTSPVGTHTDV